MVPTNRGVHSLVALTLGLFLVAFLLARQPAMPPHAATPATQTQPGR